MNTTQPQPQPMTLSQQNASDAGDCVVAVVLFGVVVFMLILEKCQSIRRRHDRALWMETHRRAKP